VLTTALIQRDKLPAAFEAENTFYFSKSGLSKKFLSLAIFFSGIALILSYLKSLTL